jgi:hypothetical protein
MIGPHLTPANFTEVLGRAKFRTKKELGKLLRELNPLPQVPDRIEPLGPALPRALHNPTWEEYVTSLSPAPGPRFASPRRTETMGATGSRRWPESRRRRPKSGR